MDHLTITRPDDWHLHLRDGAALATTVPHAAAQFGRAIVMPNLRPPVTSTEMALAYRARILAACPPGSDFNPLMTLYLTDDTAPQEIRRAKASGHIHGVKLYPAGATTNSDSGVTDLEQVYDTLAVMAEEGMPLQVHGEVTRPDIDIFDREKVFIEQTLAPLIDRFPELRIVFEHITTKDAADFVLYAGEHVAATITAHHLLLNRNDMLVGGIRPHHFCLPVLKREQHRQALLDVATSGNPKFFLGTDSAPHPKGAKESACGCAGIYTAFAAIEFYAEAFEAAGALGKLDGFAGRYGAQFYGLPVSKQTLSLARREWAVPKAFAFDEDVVIPLRAGGALHWQLLNNEETHVA
ncbi:dihydroorotase [Candidatus Tenderia electrophaga]|uniref:Dihydroorotase n=1 Tax=Candidatus Tenderia electrophaga TaxID=1748243 RepID=A0A0S2TFW4_9GAMM|nr:dihydroorotase [Candidatus Tenderia electrophaga]